MSAIGLTPDFASRTRIIGAHADHSRNHFIFPRTQSNALRDVPWGPRLKPMRCWGEIYGYAAVAFVGTILATALI